MPLESTVKKQIMTEYATVEGDTGSPEVQIAMLTKRIQAVSYTHLDVYKRQRFTCSTM